MGAGAVAAVLALGLAAGAVAQVAIVPFPQADEQVRSGADAAAVAAGELLDALGAEQRRVAVLPRDSRLRSNWSNLPSGILDFERNGVRLGDLDEEQMRLARRVLQAAFGVRGYEMFGGVLAAEAVLGKTRRAARMGWSEANYWLAFFGEPSADGDWAVQFGGHHLVANIAFAGGRVRSMSPTFLGIEPARYQLAGRSVAPMQGILDSAMRLMAVLTPEQRRGASTGRRPREVYAGPQKDGFIPPVEGAEVRAWSAPQRAALLALAEHWVAMQPAAAARARLAEIEAGLDDSHFAWHGRADGRGAIYFRLQGPRLILEFSTEGRVGSDGGHYHSVYRDPTREYGLTD